jgi:hypothetical protein
MSLHNHSPQAIEQNEANRRPLENLFNSASATILDFLIIYRDFDYSEADIARKTSLAYKTVSTIIPIFIESGIVKLTRLHGRSKMYKVNEDSDKVKGLIEYVDSAISQKIDMLKAQQ